MCVGVCGCVFVSVCVCVCEGVCVCVCVCVWTCAKLINLMTFPKITIKGACANNFILKT